MAQVISIDSNVTGLRYALEASPGVLPGSVVWKTLEPNSYADFGGSLTTLARNPINDSRQRKKGVVTDLDASGGFNMDMTQTNLQELLQSFFFANFRERASTKPFNAAEVPVVAVTTDFEAASGLDRFEVGELVFASGFAEDDNNGVHRVVDVSGTVLEVSSTLVAETSPPTASKLTMVGFQYGTDTISVDVTGSLPKIVRSGGMAASGILTIGGTPTAGQIVTIGDITYTFRTALTSPAVAYEVLIGGSANNAAANLALAIEAGAGAGTNYSLGTVAHPEVIVDDVTDEVVTVEARYTGTRGNTIATTTDVTTGWADPTLEGGAGKDFRDFNIVAGEWIFVGGDETAEKFAVAANNGFKRVRAINANEITIDKSYEAMSIDAGTGKTIRLYLGRVLKNETASGIVRRPVQFERTLGAPDDAQPTQVQAEYLIGALANQMTLNVATADKMTVDLTFLAMDAETKLASEGLKAGTRPALEESDAFNTSTDFARIKLSRVVPGDEAPTALFAYATDLTLVVNNNLSANKAISRIGAVGVTAGTFTVNGNLEVYFADVDAVRAVRDNADITIDFQLAKANSGVAWDVPLITLGEGQANIEQDQPIKLPLSMDAASAAKIDPALNHTLLLVFFDYLPNMAEAT